MVERLLTASDIFAEPRTLEIRPDTSPGALFSMHDSGAVFDRIIFDLGVSRGDAIVHLLLGWKLLAAGGAFEIRGAATNSAVSVFLSWHGHDVQLEDASGSIVGRKARQIH